MLALTKESRQRYVSANRDVFRPLQYCALYFEQPDISWLTRYIVYMSALHIESVVKRIGAVPKWPLGKALRSQLVRRVVDRPTWNRIDRFAGIYNDAKHHVGQPKDTHLFSEEDAVLAYFVGRRLGIQLYPLAALATEVTVSDDTELS